MNMKNLFLSIGAALLCCAALTSCSDDYSMSEPMHQPEVLLLDGGSDYVTLAKGEPTDWQILECPAWITPVSHKGTSSDDIRLYFESNTRTPVRQGDIIVRYANGTTYTTRASQDDKPDMRRSYAVGWGFDIRTYNDSRGLRDQIFNIQRILADEPWAYSNMRKTGSALSFYYGDDASDLQNDMKGSLNIEGKFKVFSLDLKANFGMKELNNSKRIFSTIRGRYAERMININADLKKAQKKNWFTTDFADLRQRIINSKGSDETIKELLDNYGTHFVRNAELGGCYDYYYSSVYDNSQNNLNVEAALSFAYAQKFKLDAKANYSSELSQMSNEVIEKFSVKGGDNVWITNLVFSGAIDSLSTDKWKETLDEGRLELLWFDTTPIWKLFPNGYDISSGSVSYDAENDIAKKSESYCDRIYYYDIPVTRAIKGSNVEH